MVRAMRRPAAVLAALLAAACGGDDDDGSASDGTPRDAIEIDGLDGPVTVYLDGSGVRHIACRSDVDCFAAQGYVHAADRFFQMDLRRRLARGRLSELVGEATLAVDREWRRTMTARDGRPLEEVALAGASDETVEAFEAYARGVNAWLADARDGQHGAALGPEYDFLLLAPQKDLALASEWSALDSAAAALPLVRSLTESGGSELALGEIYAALEPEVAADLFGQTPASSSAILQGPSIDPRRATLAPSPSAIDRLRAAAPLLAAARGATSLAGALGARGATGSNNWVVAPDHSTGGALLANDPHLGLAHPAVWHLIHLDAVTEGDGTLQVAGMSFPGLPGIVLGQNADLAWGATATYFDTTDVYLETLAEDGIATLLDGAAVPLVKVDYSIAVAGEDPVTLTVEVVPHHGPLLVRDDQAGTALSLRWTGHDLSTDLDFILGMARAGSVDEARQALGAVTSLGQNFVVADRAGSIGWFPYGRLPRRPWASPALPSYLPLPGDGAAEWDEYYDLAELPQAIDPPAGYLATANNDMTGALADGDPANEGWPVQTGVDPGYRHQRIVERLAGEGPHDLASMQAIQADVLSLPGQAMSPILLADSEEVALDGDATLARAALLAWDFRCPTGLATSDPDGAASDDPDERASAAGCAVFHVAFARLRAATFADDGAAAGVTAGGDALLRAFLRPGSMSREYWDDLATEEVETRGDQVAAALSAAGGFLIDELGPTTDEWLWGRLHTVTLKADLFSAAGIDLYDSGAFARDGGAYTIDVGHPDDELGDDYAMSAGASVRWTCRADGDGVACSFELPGGGPHHPSSPYFDGMIDEWLANRPSPMRFELDAARAAAVETIELVAE